MESRGHAVPIQDRVNVSLRVFIDTFQKWHHRPVYEVLVERGRAEHLAGATVLAGEASEASPA